MVRLDCAEATGYEPERSRHLSLIKAVAALARILDKFASDRPDTSLGADSGFSVANS